MNEAQVRRELAAALRRLHERGWLAANDGNAVARLERGRLLVTPSGVNKGLLRADDFLVTDRAGRVLEGRGVATGEFVMHRFVLDRRLDVDVVLHAHPPACIALSLQKGATIDGYLPETVLSLGEAPIVPYATPLTPDMASALEDYVLRCEAMVLARHGTLALGRDVSAAVGRTERLEHAAEVLCRAWAMGRPQRLVPSEQRTLRAMYERTRASSAALGRTR